MRDFRTTADEIPALSSSVATFRRDLNGVPRKASVVHGFISPAAFSAWVMTACTSMRRVRGLVGSGASLTGPPAAPDVSAVARSWRGGAGTIEADSLRLVGTARGCPVRPQNRRIRDGARRHTYAWFHLPETPPATVAGRLAAQPLVYRQFTNPGLRVRGGQTLEIATYRALQRLDADFFG